MQIESSPADIDATVRAAAKAAPEWAASEASVRAGLLRALADALDANAAALVVVADAETSLGSARLNGEVARTSFQLRGFASQVESGSAFKMEYDPGHPAADAKGYVKRPNVDPLVEVLDMREAQRAYEANLNLIDTAKAMDNDTLGIIKK